MEKFLGAALAPFLVLLVLFFIGIPVRFLICRFLPPESRIRRFLFTRIS
jgi:hypothetical protein